MPIYGVGQGCKHDQKDLDRLRALRDDPFAPDRHTSGLCFGKVPIEEEWADLPRFFERDFEEGSNLALIMGKQFDGRWLVCFDIDGELDLNLYFKLPDTLESKTGRGRHLIYEVYPDTPLGNWVNVLQTKGKKLGGREQGSLDLKYCRGAVVSPPSKSHNGKEHIWVRFVKPVMLPREVIVKLINIRKKNFPKVQRYSLWSLNPTHKGKKP